MEGYVEMLKCVALLLSYRTLASLRLRLFPSPTSPSTTHRTTGEVGKRTTCNSRNWALDARGMHFGVGEGGTIG
jgi:hypothetical protein